MLGLGNSMTTAVSPEGGVNPVRHIILIMPAGSPKSSTCTFNGAMNQATILTIDPSSPQVGDEITQNNAPTYSPLPLSVYTHGSNFKVTISTVVDGSPVIRNYHMTLNPASGKTIIDAVTSC